MTPRRIFVVLSIIAIVTLVAAGTVWPPAFLGFVLVGPLVLVGARDMIQTRHALLRNYPVIGHGRYLLEAFRPEINQYFVESNASGRPFNREERSVVYQRAKNVRDTVPFGTERDVYEVGYEWINHSIVARDAPTEALRVVVGGKDCKQPYDASIMNVGAMSFGALSSTAILALNGGAKKGGFAHNTGEGGVSPHHLARGGDLIWQLGTGYFGARAPDGDFDAERFKKTVAAPQVKMIEIKLSQGAKPGHGGILPASKLTREIAEIRGVPMGQDVLSPPAHKAFSTPVGLLRFVAQLRDLSGGKPVGFKLCVGKPHEVFAICKAMLTTGITPDFISVDGAEGGTGAAPLEFSNVVGTPLVEGLVLVHNALVGVGLRQEVRIIASGRVITGFDIAKNLALGADMVYSARGMMFSLGCIQARRCNSNDCPVGVATQNPVLAGGLQVSDKTERVYNFHKNTLHAFAEILGAAGLSSPAQLGPHHVQRRVASTSVKSYAEIYPPIAHGGLVSAPPEAYARAWHGASAESFEVTESRATPYVSLAAS